MNTQKALTTLIFIAASLIVTLIVAQLLPTDAKYFVILTALLGGVAGAIRPVVSLLLAGGEERQTILKVERAKHSS